MKATRLDALTMFLFGTILLTGGAVAAQGVANSGKEEPAENSASVQDPLWGDDSGQWPNDGECDDPRFFGPGSARILRYDELKVDASDCRELYLQGELELREGNSPEGIAWGDDTSEWANNGVCDDPRFGGPGAADSLLAEDRMRDASDCRWLFRRIRIALVFLVESDGIVWGTNASPWANDGECDDPRFSGPGSAATLVEHDRLRDADDCQALFERGAIELAENSDRDNLI